MENKPGFDDEFQPKRERCSWLVRSMGWMLSVVIVGGIALSVTAGTGKYKKGPRSSIPQAQRSVLIRQVRAPVAQERDRFVVMTAAEIDAAMVVVAPAGIDEAMVFNPDRHARQAWGAPVGVTPLIPVPGGQPGQLPYNLVPPGSLNPATPP